MVCPECRLVFNLSMLVQSSLMCNTVTVQQLQVHTVKNTGGDFEGGARVVCATQSPANE